MTADFDSDGDIAVHRATVELIRATPGAACLDDVTELRGVPWGQLIVDSTGMTVERVKAITGGAGFTPAVR